MKAEQLEKQLKKRKWIYFGIAMAFVAIAIALMCMFGFILDDRVGVIVCICLVAMGFLALLFIMRIKIRTAEIKGQHITVYKFFTVTLYIDGEEQGRATAFDMSGSALVGKLNDGTDVQVIVSAMFVRIVFSDDTPPIII